MTEAELDALEASIGKWRLIPVGVQDLAFSLLAEVRRLRSWLGEIAGPCRGPGYCKPHNNCDPCIARRALAGESDG